MFFSKSTYKFLIVGLGNMGPKYEGTRHNVGWAAIDCLADDLGVNISKQKFKSQIGEGKIGADRVLLCKPLTYMNNSGEAVAEIIKFYKIPLENVIVFSDDISLDVGRLRIRRNGSCGGHNGLRSIIDLCGGDNFPRIKIGVGAKPSPEYDLANWVLGKFGKEDSVKIADVSKLAADSAKTIVANGVDAAMNKFNK